MNKFLKGVFTLILVFSVFCTNSFAQFSNGLLDVTFDPGTGANSYVYSVVPVSGGKVLIGGLFSSFNGTAKSGICRLNKNGTLDATFGGTGISSGNRVYFIHPLAGNKFLIAGTFTQYNGVAKNRIVKINNNGSIDNTFNPGTGANGDIYMISEQADGKFILSGNFTSYNGTARNRIARINPNGSLDASFDPGTGANSQVLVAKVQADGKIIIGGNFTSFNGVSRKRVTRLNDDGSLDPTFNVGVGCNAFCTAIAIQADNQILLGGSFTGYNNVWRSNIARINPDGSLDESFVSIPGANYIIDQVIPLSNGKILAAGQFTSYNSVAKNGVIRLLSNGDLDTTYNPGGTMQTGTNNSNYSSLVYCMAMGAGGDLWLAGNFTNYNGVSRNRIAHLSVVPLTQLTATYCNTTQQLNTNMACTAVSGATQYEWEVTDAELDTVYTVTTATNRLRLNLISEATYNKIYSIQVRAFAGEWGEFGSACAVTTPPIPVSGLSPALCGITQASLSQNLTPITVLSATQYEWEITDVATDVVTTALVTKNLNLNTAGIPGYGYAKTYSIRIRAYIGVSETFGEFGSACTVSTPSIPVSGIIASQCGITLSSLSQTLTPITVLSATQYEWEITDIESDFITTAIVTRTLNLNTAGIPGYGYNKAYSIRVRAFAGAWGGFGSACTVTTPAIPVSGIIASQCGITMTSLSQTLTPITVLSATQYEWEITDVATDVVTTAIVTRTIKLNTAGIPGFGYNKAYSIRVRGFAGAWGPFGSACSVSTPAIPVSGIIASQCGITLSSLTQTLTPITVLSATQYEWEITDVATDLVTTSVVTKTIKLSTAGIPGYGNGKTYSIRVRAFAGAWGEFGSACSISTPLARGIAVIPMENQKRTVVADQLDSEPLSVFPNPNNGTFRVRGSAGSEITVTDMLGHILIQTRMEDIELPIDLSNFPNGVYQIRSGKRTVKAVKF